MQASQPPPEHFGKMASIRSLSDAIQRAKERLAKNPSPDTALEIQRLQTQRAELRGTMPPLRAVR